MKMTSLIALLLVAAAGNANAAVRSVPGTYATVAAAVAAAADGDTIEIQAGTYTAGIVATLAKDNLTLRGVNGRVHLNANGLSIANGKAIFVTTGDSITIENVEFSHTKVPDENGAGIRHEGGLLIIRNCSFHDNENGILTSNQGNGRLFIEHTQFNHNGLGRAGYTHNIYVGHIARFTLQYSYSHHATHGHNVKSRAAENFLLYNRIMDETTGNASYQIDIPDGGLTFIIGNTLHQGVNAENSHMISYAAEGAGNPVQALYVSGNTLVNDRSNGIGLRVAGSPTAIIVNTVFDHIAAGNAVEGNTTLFENNIIGDENSFNDRSHYDFHLTADSPAVDAADDPGVHEGVDLMPVHEYVHPLAEKQRELNDRLDAGAFEFSDNASDNGDSQDDPDAEDPGGDSGNDQSDDGGGSGGCYISSLIGNYQPQR